MSQVKKRENREGYPRQRSLSKSLGWEGAQRICAPADGRWFRRAGEKSWRSEWLGDSVRVARTEITEIGRAFAVPV